MAEQMVWAAAFAQYEHELKHVNKDMDPEGRILSCAMSATAVVLSMRSAFKYAGQRESVKQHLGRPAFDHLRQMTFKADD